MQFIVRLSKQINFKYIIIYYYSKNKYLQQKMSTVKIYIYYYIRVQQHISIFCIYIYVF